MLDISCLILRWLRPVGLYTATTFHRYSGMKFTLVTAETDFLGKKSGAPLLRCKKAETVKRREDSHIGLV